MGDVDSIRSAARCKRLFRDDTKHPIYWRAPHDGSLAGAAAAPRHTPAGRGALHAQPEAYSTSGLSSHFYWGSVQGPVILHSMAS